MHCHQGIPLSHYLLIQSQKMSFGRINSHIMQHKDYRRKELVLFLWKEWHDWFAAIISHLTIPVQNNLSRKDGFSLEKSLEWGFFSHHPVLYYQRLTVVPSSFFYQWARISNFSLHLETICSTMFLELCTLNFQTRPYFWFNVEIQVF